LILGYHRIADVQNDPFQICVSPKNFAEQMDILRRYTNPVSIETLYECLQTGHLPDHAVAITFDDGYSDILQEAKQILYHHNFPATVYLVTDCLGEQFWWDKLEQIISSLPTLPEVLDLTIEGKTIHWKIPRSIIQTSDESQVQIRTELLFILYRGLLKASKEERKRVLSQIGSWLLNSPDHNEQAPRALTVAETVELAASPLFQIGSHTVSHPWLFNLSSSEQYFEINASKGALEKILGQPVVTFSYPNGSSSPEIASLIKQAGYQCACTSKNDVVNVTTDVFHLPRFWVPDVNGEAFERWLMRRY
jgi:peptidoglycan/xylan/chitin deacetylase (PgdA/CDA1 family)